MTKSRKDGSPRKQLQERHRSEMRALAIGKVDMCGRVEVSLSDLDKGKAIRQFGGDALKFILFTVESVCQALFTTSLLSS